MAVSVADFNLNEQIKSMSEAMQKISAAMERTNAAIIQSQEQSQEKINDSKVKTTDKTNKSYEETAKKVNADTKDTWEKIGDKLGEYTSGLLKQYESMLNQYAAEQQKLSFNLFGSNMSYDSVKNALSVLSTNAFVKQNEVYKNLTNLVQSGITYNAAQRAFLQTTAQQVGLQFDTAGDTFNRLIQIQKADLSEARLAQMAGLKIFLEQNYQNSQYIKQGFSQVSDALIEMQSLMNAQVAMATEKTIQTYLGSFRSAGGSGNTVSSIAQALNAIGSGDFNNLGSMQNLMIMAASRAGLSYADLLNGGLNESDTEKLMINALSYIAGMSRAGGGSNAAMNAMAKVFGVSVSDIKAAQGMNLAGVNTNYDTSIGSFFGNLETSTNASTRISTLAANLMSGGALNDDLFRYTLIKDFSNIIGTGLENAGAGMGLGAGSLVSLLGSGVKALPMINVLGNVLTSASGLGSIWSLDTLKDIVRGGVGNWLGGIIGNIGEGISPGAVLSAYNGLAGLDGSRAYTSSGTFTGGGRGRTTSGTITNTDRSVNEIKIENNETGEEAKTLDDLYNLLSNDYPVTPWKTISTIAPSETEYENCVYLGNAETTHTILDMITLTAVSTEGIFMLLSNYLLNTTYSLVDMSKLPLEHRYADWSGQGE